MILLIGFLVGLFVGFIMASVITISRSCDDENDNQFGPSPTLPEPGEYAIITTYKLPPDEQYKSNDE